MPAQTARTPGNGTGTLAYTLASDSFDIESVYVSVDNTAGATAVTPELEIKDQSGVVIARKKQGATIPAGATGSATWALRLDDAAVAATTTVNQPLWDVMWSNGFGNQVFQDPTGSLDNVAWFNALGESYNGVTSLIDADPAPDSSFVYFPNSHVPLAYLLEMSFFMPADPQVPPPPVAKVWDIQAGLYKGDLGAWNFIGPLIPAAGFSYWADSDFVWVARTGNQYSAEETASLNVVVREADPDAKYAVQVVLFQSFPTGNPLTDFQPLPGARFKLTELYAPTFPPA